MTKISSSDYQIAKELLFKGDMAEFSDFLKANPALVRSCSMGAGRTLLYEAIEQYASCGLAPVNILLECGALASGEPPNDKYSISADFHWHPFSILAMRWSSYAEKVLPVIFSLIEHGATLSITTSSSHRPETLKSYLEPRFPGFVSKVLSIESSFQKRKLLEGVCVESKHHTLPSKF